MSSVRLDIAYNGADFGGWAAQPGARTVQGELEAALEQVRRELAATREAAKTAVQQTHRQYRRDLVPLNQSVTLFRSKG